MFTKRKIIIVGVIVSLLGIVAGVSMFLFSRGMWPGSQQVSAAEPAEIVSDFYDAWLEAAQSTTTDPYQAGLGNSPVLSKELRARLRDPQGGVDPVLCQAAVPAEISSRRVYEDAEEAQVLVTARKPSTSTEQALVRLLPLRDGWYISSIECSPGEFGPAREFSFDKEGRLVKNVPAPFDSQYWHLMFDEDGEPGQYVPLFFSASTSLDALVENSKVHIKGQMLEKGVEVKSIEFL